MAAGFDVSRAIRLLCNDIVARSPHLHHVDMDLVAVSIAHTRRNGRHGMWGSLTCLRFENGSRTIERNGVPYVLQSVRNPAGNEMLYLLKFYMPRFLDLEFHEALSTVVHELWHISPNFDGDLRRFPGRYHGHGPSKNAFDEQVDEVTLDYLARNPPEEVLAFLRQDFHQLYTQYGRLHGTVIRQPRMIPAAALGRDTSDPR